MFFTGSGDSDFIANLPSGYTDTMLDIITNMISAFLGALAYYLLKLKPKGHLA